MRINPALLAALVALGLAGCNDTKAERPAAPPRPVLTHAVTFAPMTPERALVGTVRARIESDLGFRVAGKVSRRLVDVGAVVVAGQPLAALDDTDLRLQREQAWAELEAARSSQRQAEAEERRTADLRKRGWSTESTFDRQKAAADETEGRVRRATRALELTENALSYAILKADAAGVVTAVPIEPGQVVAAGQIAVRVARLDEREAVVAVPEAMLERVRSGAARVALWSQADRSYPATLRELSPAADPATRTYAARFSVPGAGDEMKLGMTATVTISDTTTVRIARVPLGAILDQGAGPQVWVVDPATGALSLRPVIVAAYENAAALISAGLADGDLIVALGAHKLDAAQKVRVVARLGS